MRILLDTQIYLWFLADSPRLPDAVKDQISGATEVYVSAASIWESCIKIGIGKLDADPSELLSGIEGSGFEELPVSAEDAAAVADLPPHHRDPFDRLLVAQAMAGPLILLSSDEILRRYTELVKLVSPVGHQERKK